MGKKIFNIIIGCLAFVGAFISILYIYVLSTRKDIYSDSVSTYALGVTDPQTGDQLPPLSLNYYQNLNGSGKEVIEFKINAYSDQKKQALYGKGYQLVFEKDGTAKMYYYDSFDGESWDSGHIYDETNEDGQQKNFFYIDIDGELTAVRLDGSYTRLVENNIVGLRRFGNAIINFAAFNWFGKPKDYCNEYKEEKAFYNYTDLLKKMRSIALSSSYGTGSYVMPLVDLGDFLHMYKVAKDGTVAEQPIGGDKGQINSYFSIAVNYDKRGMVYVGQSMFKSVALDSSFNVSGLDFDVNYWKTGIEFNISQEDFVARYSSIDKGYYYSLPSKLISELKTFDSLEINIVFDCTKFSDTKILGFDNYAFYGIKINSLKIIGNNNNFNLMVGCLKDTGLSKIITHNVNINNLSGMEVQYEVV